MDAQITYVVSLRNHFAAYHNHKEMMAWLGTAFVYAAQFGIWTAKPTDSSIVWLLPEQWVRLVLSLFAFSLGYLFVTWQLRHREMAGAIVNGCLKVEIAAVAGEAIDIQPKGGKRATKQYLLAWWMPPGEPSAYNLPAGVRDCMDRPQGPRYAGALTVLPLVAGLLVILGLAVREAVELL